ncbi:MAG: pectate lyase [Fibrella sp.]|nr:pectate lyase [Armatimonadota bacterium]
MICPYPVPSAMIAPSVPPISWKDALRQPADWYRGSAAVRIADTVIRHQNQDGGWNKNVDPTLLTAKPDHAESTIDNGATWTHLMFLARVYDATNENRIQTAFLKGIDYLLAAQYPNGGFPQYFPLRKGYYTHITFNDDAMVNVLGLLRAVTRGDVEYRFVDAERRARCRRAVQQGVACILRCQIVVDGKKTVWCAQHDEKSFAPAPARAYEKASLSGSESVGIVRFLMGIEKPDAAVQAAIQNAVAWFESAKLSGVRYEERKLVLDPSAPPLWARFYELGTNRPIFSGRDGVVRYRLEEVEKERREGYNWYTTSPQELLSSEYPAWKARIGR